MAYVIGDFSFETEEDAREAQKEVQAISYIMKQIDNEDPKAVLAAYQQMVKKDLFHTKLGLGFLEDMRKQLLALPEIDAADLPPVPSLPPKPETERLLIKEEEAPAPKRPVEKKEGAKPAPKPGAEEKRAGGKSASRPTRQTKEEKVEKVEKASRKEKKQKEKIEDLTPEKMTVALKRYKKLSRLLLIACITMLLIIIGMFAINATSQNPTILNYEEKIVDKYASWEEELDAREQELNEREQKLNQ